MIEGRDELDFTRQQHAVAEHVTGHVTDAGDRKRLFLSIDAELTKMSLDCFPSSARGDSHFLVVVACRTTRCEGIIKPETVVARNSIGDIGKGGRALVCCHDEIRIVTVATNNAFR